VQDEAEVQSSDHRQKPFTLTLTNRTRPTFNQKQRKSLHFGNRQHQPLTHIEGATTTQKATSNALTNNCNTRPRHHAIRKQRNIRQRSRYVK